MTSPRNRYQSDGYRKNNRIDGRFKKHCSNANAKKMITNISGKFRFLVRQGEIIAASIFLNNHIQIPNYII